MRMQRRSARTRRYRAQSPEMGQKDRDEYGDQSNEKESNCHGAPLRHSEGCLHTDEYRSDTSHAGLWVARDRARALGLKLGGYL